jgi:hypothetical protein
MKIVIDIPEYVYEIIKKCGSGAPKAIDDAIVNGTPLPKNHGRLGDLDAVMSDISTSIDAMTNIGMVVDSEYLWAKLNDAIYNAPTIIEADKAESEDNK